MMKLIILLWVVILFSDETPVNLNSFIKERRKSNDKGTAQMATYLQNDTLPMNLFIWTPHLLDSISTEIYNLHKIQKLVLNSSCNITIVLPTLGASNEFHFSVGFSERDRFRSLYNFYFNPKNKTLLYMDVVKNKFINVKKWDNLRD